MAEKFEDLRTFVTVVETGGIGTAAAALGIVKSAVSRRLSDLEERLGVTLIVRTTRTLDLTETGRLFLDRARAILAEVESLERIGEAAAGEPLKVSIDAALAPAILPSLVALSVALPDLRVALVRGPADVTIELAEPATAPDPRWRVLATTPMINCASPAYLARLGTLATVSDLGGHDIIALTGQAAPRRSAACGWLEVSDLASAVSSAVAGAGIASVPYAAVAEAIATGALIRLDAEQNAEPRHVIGLAAPQAPATAALTLDRISEDLRGQPV